jgi:hypothetical protein
MMPDVQELCARLTQALEAIQDGDLDYAAAIVENILDEVERGAR